MSWLSKREIMQDLSLLQGFTQPEIECTVIGDDKPPSLNFTEETEEDFFRDCTGDGEAVASPDLDLIKKMIEMVRDDVSEEEVDTGYTIITKLNPEAQPFEPANTKLLTAETTKKCKHKTPRNVALESILKAKADKNHNDVVKSEPEEPLKLLKPNDFIYNDHKQLSDKQSYNQDLEELKSPESETLKDQKAIEKVNGWLETHLQPLPNKAPAVKLQMTNMFKKKNSVSKVTSLESRSVQSPCSSDDGAYKPSEQAKEYSRKFEERRRIKQATEEDMWARAKRLMKDIDEKRRLQVEAAASLPGSSTPTSVSNERDGTLVPGCSIHKGGLAIVRLPQPRHLLSTDCVVCSVMLDSITGPNSNTKNRTPNLESEHEDNCIDTNSTRNDDYVRNLEQEHQDNCIDTNSTRNDDYLRNLEQEHQDYCIDTNSTRNDDYVRNLEQEHQDNCIDTNSTRNDDYLRNLEQEHQDNCIDTNCTRNDDYVLNLEQQHQDNCVDTNSTRNDDGVPNLEQECQDNCVHTDSIIIDEGVIKEDADLITFDD